MTHLFAVKVRLLNVRPLDEIDEKTFALIEGLVVSLSQGDRI